MLLSCKYTYILYDFKFYCEKSTVCYVLIIVLAGILELKLFSSL